LVSVRIGCSDRRSVCFNWTKAKFVLTDKMSQLNPFDELLNRLIQPALLKLKSIKRAEVTEKESDSMPNKVARKVKMITSDDESSSEDEKPARSRKRVNNDRPTRGRVFTYDELAVQKRKLSKYREELKREQEEDRMYRRLDRGKENWKHDGSDDENDVMDSDDSLADFVVDDHTIDRIDIKDTSRSQPSDSSFRNFIDDECEEGEEEIDDHVSDEEEELYIRMKGIKDYYEEDKPANESEEEMWSDDEDEPQERGRRRRRRAAGFVLDEVDVDDDCSADEQIEEEDDYESDFVDDGATQYLDSSIADSPKQVKRKRKILESDDSDDEVMVVQNVELLSQDNSEDESNIRRPKRRVRPLFDEDDVKVEEKPITGVSFKKKQMIVSDDESDKDAPEVVQIKKEAKLPVAIDLAATSALNETFDFTSSQPDQFMHEFSIDNISTQQLIEGLSTIQPYNENSKTLTIVEATPKMDLDSVQKLKPIVTEKPAIEIKSVSEHDDFSKKFNHFQTETKEAKMKLIPLKCTLPVEHKMPEDMKVPKLQTLPNVNLTEEDVKDIFDSDFKSDFDTFDDSFDVILDSSTDLMDPVNQSFTASELDCSRLSERLRRKANRRPSMLNLLVYYSN
jgi:hypothetical protein